MACFHCIHICHDTYTSIGVSVYRRTSITYTAAIEHHHHHRTATHRIKMSLDGCNYMRCILNGMSSIYNIAQLWVVTLHSISFSLCFVSFYFIHFQLAAFAALWRYYQSIWSVPSITQYEKSINICSIPFLSFLFLFLYHSVSWYTDICAALEQASKTKTQKTYYTHSHVCIETVTGALGVRKWIEVCILLNGIGIECEPKHINTQTKTK